MEYASQPGSGIAGLLLFALYPAGCGQTVDIAPGTTFRTWSMPARQEGTFGGSPSTRPRNGDIFTEPGRFRAR